MNNPTSDLCEANKKLQKPLVRKRKREEETGNIKAAVFWIWLPDRLPDEDLANIKKVMTYHENCDFFLICSPEHNDHLATDGLTLISLKMFSDYLKTLQDTKTFNDDMCTEFIQNHEDLTNEDAHRHHSVYTMLSDLLRVHYSLYLLAGGCYESVLYLDTDIRIETPAPMAQWLSAGEPVLLSKDENDLVDFDIMGIKKDAGAIRFLLSIQTFQNEQEGYIRGKRNQIRSGIFNPLGTEEMDPPEKVTLWNKLESVNDYNQLEQAFSA